MLTIIVKVVVCAISPSSLRPHLSLAEAQLTFNAGAILVNTSSSRLLDDCALKQAIIDGTVAGCALDGVEGPHWLEAWVWKAYFYSASKILPSIVPPFHLILCYALKVVFADVIICEALKLPSSTLTINYWRLNVLCYKASVQEQLNFGAITITLCNMYVDKLDNGWKEQHIECEHTDLASLSEKQLQIK